MRTPLILVAGHGDTDAAAERLLHEPGTLVVEHRFDGHVVRRTLTTSVDDAPVVREAILELAHGCLSCTVRNDLLVLLRTLHRRDDVTRIVVRLAPWLEPEPICWAVQHVRVRVGPGYPDGPAARDVEIVGVVVCVDVATWLPEALSDEELPDGRTVAQVVVGQAEFADALVLTAPHAETLEVLRRLAPRARLTVGVDRLEQSLAHLDVGARRGRSDDPHGPLLAGEPPLRSAGRVSLLEFNARRPFHPQRLHDAIDLLLDGVVRTRGRLWLAGRGEQAMWLESAGGGLRVSSAGKWLSAMNSHEVAYVEPERRAIADLMWHRRWGDRHSALVALLVGADPAEIDAALTGALLTDAEMARETLDGATRYVDPFGDWHEDPCGHEPSRPAPTITADEGERP